MLLARCGREREAGELLMGAGLPAEAAPLLEQAGDWVGVALCREGLGQHERAADAYRRADRPAEAARCYQAAGRPERAGELYAAAGRHSEAITCFLQAGRLHDAASSYQHNGQPLEAAGCLVQAGAREEALRVLRGIAAGSRDFPRAALSMAPLLIDRGELAEALERVRRVPAEPADSDLARERLYWEGLILDQLGRGGEASQRWRRLLTPGAAAAERALPAPAALPAGDETSQARAALAAGLLPAGYVLAGRYEIRAEIGRGGMSCVYRGFDRELSEAVALKTVWRLQARNVAEEARLLREVQICRRLTHPNSVRVFDLGRFEGGVFFTMELLEGENLGRVLARSGALPLERCRWVLGGALAGLAEAHAQGVVHRDLKPENLFLTRERVKVLDFGIAHMRDIDARLTSTGQAMGTPQFMSPEQVRGEPPDARADLYSLGLVAYLMLAGRGPFPPPAGRSAAAIAFDHVQAQPQDLRDLRPDLPEPWAALVHALLAKQAAARPASAAEVLARVGELPG